MPLYDSFKQDWKNTKKAMEKISGGKKPAETKMILGIEKRVSSGIGAALKALDKAAPQDPALPTQQELMKFRKIIIRLRKAIKAELGLIQAEVDNYRDPQTKEPIQEKDKYYRALKVFKAKLKHYDAAAAQMLTEYQQARDTQSSEGEKRIAKYLTVCKQRLAKAAVAVKKINAEPTYESYNGGIGDIRQAFADNRSDAQVIAGWFESSQTRCDVREGDLQQQYRMLTEVATRVDQGASEQQVLRITSLINKLIKQSISSLNAVTLPK